MRILIAEDDSVTRSLLKELLSRWGHEAVLACDGTEALAILAGATPPPVAVLDWRMPGMDGVEVCRTVRKTSRGGLPYILMLTSMGERQDVIHALDAGANDYLTKPFDHQELRARVGVGIRMVELQDLLAARVSELEEALARVKQLSGLLPICAYCKRVRDDRNYWQQVEAYVGQHSEARFSHSICPECYKNQVQPELDRLTSRSS